MHLSRTRIIVAGALALCLAVAAAVYFANRSDLAWQYRFMAAVDSEKYEAAVATIEGMSQSKGTALNSLPMDSLWRLDSSLKESGQKALRRRLLAVLASDRYDPDETAVPPDDFRLSYARMLMDAGDSKRARALALALRNPGSIGEASLDLRLRGFFPAEVDVRAAAEAELAAHREAMARHPDRLQPVFETSENLRQLGRVQEALKLLRSAKAKLDDPGAFTDLEENLGWFWDNVGRTYVMLGRYDDALAAYAKGGSAGEHGNLNVSQVLNMAAKQIRFGRNEDALRTIAVFDDPKRLRSAYGEMVLRYVRGCAHAFAGRPALAAADVAYAKAHEKDNEGVYAELLLCTGDMDGAAAAYIKRLDDPEQRSEVLMTFSDFDDPPVAVQPDPFDALMDAIEARPDVKAAIRRAGGVRRFRVQGFWV
jgi:tetratricopeptide (TPR) repeat protein